MNKEILKKYNLTQKQVDYWTELHPSILDYEDDTNICEKVKSYQEWFSDEIEALEKAKKNLEWKEKMLGLIKKRTELRRCECGRVIHRFGSCCDSRDYVDPGDE